MIPGRSPVVRLAVHVVTPLALLLATYLFFAGHNQPGGGFAAGLVLGAVAALRSAARLAVPGRPRQWLAAGALVIAATSLAPLLWGDDVLNQAVVSADLPLLGTVKSGTALVFDAGVVLVVVGLMLAVLEGLDLESLGRDDGDRSPTPPVRP